MEQYFQEPPPGNFIKGGDDFEKPPIFIIICIILLFIFIYKNYDYQNKSEYNYKKNSIY